MLLFGFLGTTKNALLASGAASRSSLKKGSQATSKRIPRKRYGVPQYETIVVPCSCCGVLLTYGLNFQSYRCSVCHTTHVLLGGEEHEGVANGTHMHPISYEYVKDMIQQSLANATPKTVEPSTSSGENQEQTTPVVRKRSLHETFEPLLTYLYNAFRNKQCLNTSFYVRDLVSGEPRSVHGIKDINTMEILLLFQMLTRLPTKRPLYSALSGANECLKRIPASFSDDPADYRWLLVLFEVPFLDHAVMINREKYATSMISNIEIKTLTYDVFRRVLGLLAHIKSVKSINALVLSLSEMDKSQFVKKVDLVNLYITFQLQSYYKMSENYAQRRNSTGMPLATTTVSVESSRRAKEEDELMLQSRSRSSVSRKSSKKKHDPKIRIQQYNNDWHLKTAAMVMSLFSKANYKRNDLDKLPCSNFYNSLVDFVNMKMDFDAWQLVLLDNINSEKGNLETQPEELRSAIKYITGTLTYELDSFFFCQYPILISLGNKISILEHEARLQMERKAEEAFINSLDKRVTFDVYFRVHVRRDYIVQDSLRCIEQNQKNLKKSLKVTFIDEPGVDAGGLRKEWFLILTRLLFRPMTGMISYVELSNFLWFNMIPQEDFQMYYLLGAVLGLALYNSAILDLKFPKSFYKILLSQPVGFRDFEELYPELATNLLKLKTYSAEEMEALDLKFELDLHDEVFKDNDIHYELIPNGKNIAVDVSNRNLYIKQYYQFYMGDGIAKQLESFQRGFSNVVGGNALSLFGAEEIRLMLCGSDEPTIDLAIWRSVTKYSGGYTKDTPIVMWLWNYLDKLPISQQKKFLLFVTGSDRVPATGIQNLTFKVTRLGSNSNRLPVAHTCFNELCLYDYSTEEKFIKKLETAFNESAGFGIK